MPEKSSFKRGMLKQAQLLILVFAVGGICLVEFIQKLSIERQQQQQYQQTVNTLIMVRSKLEQSLTRSIQAGLSLGTYFSINPTPDIKEARLVSAETLRRFSEIERIRVISRDGDEFIYPLATVPGERSFERNNNWAQKADVAMGLSRERIGTPGYQSDGFLGLSVRAPIYSTFYLYRGHYWGELKLVLNLSRLIRKATADISASEYVFAFTHSDTPPVIDSRFYGSEKIISQHDAKVSVQFNGAHWSLYGKRLRPLGDGYVERNMTRLIGYPLLLVVGGLFWLLVLSYRQVRSTALTDMLTGLPNRRLLIDRIQQLVKARDAKFAILFIDLNKFKSINDTYGHQVGDDFLLHVAEVLQTFCRQGDTVARVGGDEFVMIMPGANPEIETLMEKVHQHLLANPFQYREHTFSIIASIGIARYPVDGRNVDELLNLADKAMYRNKKAATA